MSFSGKRILITGASSGIGCACASKLHEAGAHVIPISRNESALLNLGFVGSQVYALDLTDEAALKSLASRLKTEVGSVDGCVLAAGVHSFRPLVMESFTDIHRPWAINVQSCLGLLALLMKNRLIAKGGSVVLFSSAAAHQAGGGASSYASTKGALEAATSSLAIEFAPQRIRVNAVCPGVVRTPMSDRFLSKLTPEQVRQLEARHPLGFGSPEDVALPVLFLLSDHARWMTGTVLRVDGGFAIA